MKIVVTGAAGLVGQNLVPRLKARGHTELIAIDKHPVNTAILRKLHPGLTVIEADLAQDGPWTDALRGCDVLVHNHAQIGALTYDPFHANNVLASQKVLEAAKTQGVPYMVHISSSVVNSMARDFYTESKKEQERIAVESGIPACILRPTLMFGWFDRKHLGWLARFMQRMPAFPIPGNGRYLRQPLYVGDFCDVIISAVERPRPGEAFNITGQEKIDYIDLMREVKAAIGSRALIFTIPYGLFQLLLDTYALVDRNPPFTSKQLAALVTPDVFEVIDWPGIFDVRSTPLPTALAETFQHPVYSKVVLEF
ncbi:MAG: NAD-dependent epimerase/dehydratase family protein [Hyphomicrobium sp.]|jgi:nucleoside-diphosphate-sugar epimerase